MTERSTWDGEDGNPEEGEPEITIEVKTLDLEGKGYYPKYRKLMTWKEAFTDPTNATLQTIREAHEFLIEYIVKPEEREEKEALMDLMTAEQFMDLFGRIAGGQQAVPPTRSEG